MIKIRSALVALVALLAFIAFGGHIYELCASHASAVLSAIAAVSLGLAGTVTYKTPTTSQPTAAQMQKLSKLTCSVALADGAASQAIVHNWGLTSPELADLYPIVNYYATTAGTGWPGVSFSFPDGNTVVLNKNTNAGSGATWTVVLDRPHTNSL